VLERIIRRCCLHTDIDPNGGEPANGFGALSLPASPLSSAQLRPDDRETTAGERCGERWRAVPRSW
jgi:hypothetical protein